MPATLIRRVLMVLGALSIALVSVESRACWWSHHCRCHVHSGGSYSSAPAWQAAAAQAPATQAPAAAATVAFAPAYYYQPMAMAQVQLAPTQAAPVGAQSSLTQVAGAIELLKLIRGLRDEVIDNRRETEGEPDSPGSSLDLSKLERLVGDLKDGQEDLKGRVINNAGISRSIGEKVVEINARLENVEERLGPDGDIIENLKQVIRDIREHSHGNATPAEEATEDSTVETASFTSYNAAIRDSSSGASRIPVTQSSNVDRVITTLHGESRRRAETIYFARREPRE